MSFGNPSSTVARRAVNTESAATARRTFSNVASTMTSADSAMIPTTVTLAVNDCGPSPSSSDATPREIGKRDNASASMFRFPGTQRAVKLSRAILSRRRSSRGLSSLSKNTHLEWGSTGGGPSLDQNLIVLPRIAKLLHGPRCCQTFEFDHGVSCLGGAEKSRSGLNDVPYS